MKETEKQKIEKINKLQINMSPKALAELEELRKQIDAPTKTEVVRSSIKLFRYIKARQKEGARIIIQDKDGNHRELVL